MRIVQPSKNGQIFEESGFGMDADFAAEASPGARMIWSDAEAAFIDPSSMSTPKDHGSGWLRQRGVSVFVVARPDAMVLEVVRVAVETGKRGKIAVLNAHDGRRLVEDMSFRMSPDGNETYKRARAAFQGWTIAWIGQGATTPALVLTKESRGVRQWAFARIGVGAMYIEVDRAMTLDMIAARAHGRAAA